MPTLQQRRVVLAAVTAAGIPSIASLSEVLGLRLDLDADKDVSTEGTGGATQLVAASSQSYSVASNSTLQVGGGISWTVAGWIYVDSLANFRALVAKSTGSNAVSEFDILIGSTGNVLFEVYGSPGGQTVTASAAVAAGTWAFIRAWFDTADNKPRLQVNDGTIVVGTAMTITSQAQAFKIGILNTSQFHNGRIAHLGKWNRVLTAAEHLTLENGGLGLDYASLPASLKTSLQSYWDFAAGALAADSHGTNTLTAVNAPTSANGPSALATAADTNTVRAWKDQVSGTQYVQQGATKRPTWRSGIRNGHGAVRFAGAHALVAPTGPDLSNTKAITLYAVSNAATASGVLAELSAAYTGQTTAFLWWRNASNQLEAKLKGDGGTSGWVGIRTPSRHEILSCVLDKSIVTTGRALIDPTEAQGYTGGLPDNGSNGWNPVAENTNVFGSGLPLYLGAENQASFFLNGDFLRFALYDRNHSVTERVQVSRLLRDTYDLKHAGGTLICEGDSNTAAFGATSPWPTQLAAATAFDLNIGNFGLSGQTMAQMLARAPTNIVPWIGFDLGKTVVVIWGGTNDIAAGISGAATWAMTQAECALVRSYGAKAVVATMLPRSNGISNQTLYNTERADYNTRARNNPASYDGLADLAADGRIGDDGDQTDLTYFQADQGHLNNTGQSIPAGIIRTAVELLL